MRDFFRRAVPTYTSPSGTVITSIQAALNASGGIPIPVDGLFGQQTISALKEYQGRSGLTQSGTVSDTTWSALMRSPEPAIFERCLQLTASFEGTHFTQVVGNFDGAGITWGIIGFTLINNELGAVLRAVNARYPDLIGKAFGTDASEVLDISDPSTSQAAKTAWADSISRGQSKYAVAEPWRTYFYDLGTYREVQKIQVDRAHDIYWKIAVSDAGALSMTEELDFMLMYDVAVQNGGMNSKGRLAKAKDLLKANPPKTASEKRAIIGQVVADTSATKYKKDVLKRKMTIASGTGGVHGGLYNLDDWGLKDGQTPAET